MRMIDANALQDQYIAKMEEVVKSTTTPNISLEALSLLCGYALIMDAPTIKAEPKHGKWIVNNETEEWVTIYCDQCHDGMWNRKGDPYPNYCCNCGADMREESDIDENWYSDEYRRIGEDERDEQ